MKMTIDQMQEAACRMFRTVVEILEEESFPYVGFFGTMLGTVRHQGPIPWDSDVDIAIPEPELDRFVDLMNRRLPPEYWLDFRNPDALDRTIPRIGLAGYETRFLHIDVFRIVGLPNQRWKQFLFKKYCRALISLRCAKVYSYTGKKKLMVDLVRAATFYHSAEYYAQRYDNLCKRYPYETAEFVGNPGGRRKYTREIFDTVLMPYADFSIRIPKKYDAWLQYFYGDYHCLPPEEERSAGLRAIFDVVELNAKDHE